MTRPPEQSGSLEQAVARALKEIPHDAICATLLGEFSAPCDCSREQRLAARVAAALEAAAKYARGDEDDAGSDIDARDDALRALTQREAE